MKRQKPVILLKLEACNLLEVIALKGGSLHAILQKMRYFVGIFQGCYLHFNQFSTGFLHFRTLLKTVLIYDLINNLGYLSVPYYSRIFVPSRKINASNIIQVKVKNDIRKTNGVEIIFNIKL